LLVEGDDLGEIDVGQRIAGDDEERAVEVVADLPHGSTSAKGCLLDGVAEPHPQPAAVGIAVLDDRGEVLQRHEGFVDAVTEQEVEDVAKAGLVHDLHHRLRPIDRERSQAAPLAAGHDDGLHRVEFRPASDAQADALRLGSKRARRRACASCGCRKPSARAHQQPYIAEYSGQPGTWRPPAVFRVAAGLGVVGAAATPQLRGALTSAALGAGVTTLASNVVTDALGVGVAPDSGWVDPGNLYLCDP